MVSVLFDYGRQRVPHDSWTPKTFRQFQELARQTQKLDESLGEPDCEDPAKAEWMKAVESRLEALESRAFRGDKAVG